MNIIGKRSWILFFILLFIGLSYPALGKSTYLGWEKEPKIMYFTGGVVQGNERSSSQGRTQTPEIFPILPGAKVVTGRAEKGAKILLYDQDGYLMSITWAYSGPYEVEIGREAVKGEIFQVYAIEGKREISLPGKKKVSDYETKLTFDPVKPTDQVLKGSTNPSYYVEVRNEKSQTLGHGFADALGYVSVELLRPLESGEKIQVIIGQTPTTAEEQTWITVGEVKTPPPRVSSVFHGVKKVKGEASPKAFIRLFDDEKREMGRIIADDRGYFDMDLSAPLMRGKTYYLTAQLPYLSGSEKTQVFIKEAPPTEKPIIDVVRAYTMAITGKTDVYGRILVVDETGNYLGENWAGPSGRFTVSLNRKTRSGEVLRIQATAKDSAPSEEVRIHVESEKPSEQIVAYVKGYKDGTFRPNAHVSRSEVAVMFHRLLTNQQGGNGTSVFRDVQGKWFEVAVSYLTKEGYMRGYPDGKFHPMAKMTRGEVAVMIAPYLRDFESKPDFVDTQYHWAKNGIRKVYGNDIITGYPDGTFRPDQPITRAEAVKIFNILFHRHTTEMSLRDIPLSERKDFQDVGRSHWAYYHILDAATSHKVDRNDPTERWIAY